MEDFEFFNYVGDVLFFVEGEINIINVMSFWVVVDGCGGLFVLLFFLNVIRDFKFEMEMRFMDFWWGL